MSPSAYARRLDLYNTLAVLATPTGPLDSL